MTLDFPTIEGIRKLLEVNDRAVERAVVAIYREQTRDEQRSRTAKHNNGVGFNAADATLLSEYAERLLNGRRLYHFELAECRIRISKYARQLHTIAVARAVENLSK